MFKSLFKSFAGHKDAHELPQPAKAKAVGIEDLLAGEGQGDRIPLGAIHAQFDTMGQNRASKNQRTSTVVKVMRVPNQG
ncbi:hypothetical protein [Acuticoccus sp. I52.16.1]|uniref:hypothetical protein n=1 Tax=Acuticoccus sp. I52.16.1 TaxID=2928472 RepID=UPI001FD3627D|nr:hypothetical protein [Acuticoccus sp. I52.16.1]UOM34531.1 hypothetical protein MRB58_22405 [Acuticoccus sp. I52.16.1]